jgi:hypothetical protein
MTKKLLLIAIAACPLMALSQAASDPKISDVNIFKNAMTGRNIYTPPNNMTMDGSPFLLDEYAPMEITLMQGTVHRGVRVKFNVPDNQVIFVDDNGAEMITGTPIKKLKYKRVKEDGSGMEEIVLESFNSALNVKGAPVYEVLSEGKAKLLKKIEISYSDVRKYPEGTMSRVFKRKSFYYASINDQAPVKLEKSKSAILELLADKKTEVTAFIEKEKLKCRTEAEIIMVFEYYSTLN